MNKKLSHNLQGILWILSCNFFFTLMMTVVKYFAAAHKFLPLQLNYIRSFIVFVVMLGFMMFKGESKKLLEFPNLKFQLLRVAFGVGAMVCMFYTFAYLPMAQATTLIFSQSLFVTVLASIFLKERVTWHRWTAIIAGYLGVIIAMNPTYDGISTREMVAILGCLLGAATNIVVKHLTTSTSANALVVYSAVGTLVLTLPFVMPDWAPITLEDCPMLLATGLFALIAQYSYIRAYHVADVSFLAPFYYTKLIFTTAVGFFIFGEIPQISTWIGAAIVIASAFLVQSSFSKRLFKRLQKSPDSL